MKYIMNMKLRHDKRIKLKKTDKNKRKHVFYLQCLNYQSAALSGEGGGNLEHMV